MAGEIGAGFGLDLSNLVAYANKADKKVMDMVEHAQQLNAELSKAVASFQSMGVVKDLGAELKKFKGQSLDISLNIDTKPLEKVYDVIKDIIGSVSVLTDSGKGAEIIDVKSIYEAKGSVSEVKRELDGMYDSMISSLNEYNKLQEITFTRKDFESKTFEYEEFKPVVNPKRNEPYKDSSKTQQAARREYEEKLALARKAFEEEQALALKAHNAEQDRLQREFNDMKAAEMAKHKLIIESKVKEQALLNEKLNWFKMTEDERASYQKKTADEVFNAEIESIKKARSEYERILNEQVELTDNIGGVGELGLSAEDAKSYTDLLLKDYQQLDVERRELESRYSAYIVDIAKSAQEKIGHIEADRRRRTLEQEASAVKSSLEANAKGEVRNVDANGSALELLSKIKHSLDTINNTEVGPKFDLESIERYHKVMSQIFSESSELVSKSREPIKFHDPNDLGATTQGLDEVEARYKAINQEIKNAKFLLTTLKSGAVPDIDIFQGFVDKDGNLIESKREEFEMLKNFIIAEQELILKQDIEKRAIAKKELQWANMTEAERVAYVEKELQKELAAHKKHIEEVRKEYRGATNTMVDIMRKSDNLKKADIGDDAIPMQAEYDRQYEEADSKRRELESEYAEYLVDIANDTQRKILVIEQNRIKARQEYDRKHMTAEQALKQAGSARTGFEMEEAKEAVKTALFNVDKDDAEAIDKLNKAYIELRGSLEKLTRAQENEKTLQPTVRNEYSRLLKELDKVRKAKEKLEKTEVYKTAQHYQSIGRGGVLSQDEQAALEHYAKLEEYENQLSEKKKTIAETTGELIKEVEVKHAAETSQARIDEITKEEAKKLELVKQRLAAERAERSKYGSISADSANAMVQKIGADARNEQTGEFNIKNIEQAKEAINRLKEARAHLDTTTSKGREALARMNAEIEKHEHNIKMATDATYRQKKAEEEAWENNTSSKEAAIAYADNAKSIKDMTQAIKYLKEVRDSLEKGDGKAGAKKYAEDLEEINGKINELEAGMKKAKGEAVNLGTTASQLTARLAQVFSVRALFNYARGIADVTGEFEKQRKALRVLIGDQEKSARIWEKTVELAVNSPYEVKELVTYTKQLSAYRVEADKIFEKTKMLADVASGLGVDMNRLILAYGQVKAANYLRATELRQFSEAGVNMLKELSDYYKEIEGRAVSVAEVFNRISNRGVTFTDVDKVLTKITSVGGPFYKMQEEQSKTIGGMITNIKDSFSIMKDEIGRENDVLIRAFLNGLKQIMNHWEIIGKIATPLLTVIISKTLLFNRLTGGILKTAKMWGVTMQSIVKLFKDGAAAARNFAIANQMNPLNMWATIASVAFTAIMSIIGAMAKYKAQLKEIRKEHEEFTEDLSKIRMEFNLAGANNDIDTQKEKLSELVAIANKEYNMRINISIKGMSAKEIADEFNNIEQMLKDAANFSANADEDFIKHGVGQKMEKDMKQYSDAIRDLVKEVNKNYGNVLNISDNVFGAGLATQVAEAKALITKKRDEETESDEMVTQRRLKGYKLLSEAYKKYEKQYMDALKERNVFGRAATTQWENHQKRFSKLGLDDTKLGDALTNYLYKQEEAYSEFYAFLDKESENLTHLEKERQAEVVKSWIDTKSDEERWGEVMRNQLYELANEQYQFTGEIEIKPNYVPPTEVELAAWQETYNKMFKSYKGFSEITQLETSQDDVIKRLDDEKKKLTDLIARIKAAGGKVATESGAYQGMNLDELEKQLRDVETQREWFGAQDKKEQKEKDKAIKNYISLIKEMRSEYLNLKNTMDAASAEQRVMTSYAESFAEVFKDAGISITDKIIDPAAIDNLIKAGEVSEEVAEKLKELQSSGTYIRTFSDEGLEFTKSWERLIEEAEALGDTRNGEKVWTYGYGETHGVKEGDKISEADASALLKSRMTADYSKDLNDILDKNKELILTQEQYNALLDLTYQGGKGALERLIEYAKDNEKALEHVQSLHDKYVASGQNEKAEFFGKDFQDNLTATENIYQRLAILLNTMNLTVNGGKVQTVDKEGNKENWDGLLKRSKARAALFSMGEDVGAELSQIIGESITDFSSIDITTPEGIVEFFESLKPRARLAGEQAMISLTRAIAEYKTQIDVRGLEIKSANMASKVEEMFGNYQLSLEFSDVNVPKEMTEKLFNFEHIELDELKEGVIETYSTAQKYDEVINDSLMNLGNHFHQLKEGVLGINELAAAGYSKDFNELFLSKTDETGAKFVLSPVTPDGELLTRDELVSYWNKLQQGAEDDLKLLVKVDVSNFDKVKQNLGDNLTAKNFDTKRLQDELNKGLHEIDWSIVADLTNEKDMEKIKSYLEKIEELELKHRRDIFKKYVEYAQAETTERAKIKLNELRTIADIEKTFAEMAKEDGADTDLLNSQKEAAINKAVVESKKAIAKLDLEAIKNSKTMEIALGNTGGASKQLLESTIKYLEEFRKKLKEIGDVDGVKEVNEQLQALQNQLIECDNYGRELIETRRDFLSLFKASKSDESWEKFSADEENKDKKRFEFQSEEAKKLLYGDGSDKKRVTLEGINQALALEIAHNEALTAEYTNQKGLMESALGLTNQNLDTTNLTAQQLGELTKYRSMDRVALEALYQENENNLEATIEQGDAISEQVGVLTKLKALAEAFAAKLNKAKANIQKARGLYNDVLDLLGESEDSSAWNCFGNLAFDMAETVISAAMLNPELLKAELSAQAFGTAMKSAMGPIGWILIAIELIVKAISAIVKWNKAKKEDRLKELIEEAEELREEFDELVDTIGDMSGIAGLSGVKKDIDEAYKSAKAANRAAIAEAEDSKKVQKAKNGNKKAKNSDEYKQYKELLEEQKQLDKDYAEAKKEIYSQATAGVFDDQLAAARNFVDAWWDAFMETGEGLTGLKDNFKDFFADIIKQQLSLRYVNKFIDKWMKDLDKYINVEKNDLTLTTDEAMTLANKWSEDLTGMNNGLESLAGVFKSMFGAISDNVEVDGLQKGIQGITEDQADVLTAYWNAVRFDIADIKDRFEGFYNKWTSKAEGDNPMYDALIGIKQILDSVRSTKGDAIRVEMV